MPSALLPLLPPCEECFGGFKTADFQPRFDKLPGLILVQGSENQGREFEPQLVLHSIVD